MPTAEVNGVKLSYSAQGDGEAVVLIGGFGGDINFYRTLIPILAKKYKVIVLDNRGAGATEYNGPFRGQDMVDDVAALLDHLSVYRAHILGWSMGGHIAQEFAIQNPDRTQSLTLVSAYMRRPARSSYF
ncbi:MAG: alpha/beta fold hydrolase, partial [Candidatus Methanomethylophilaceae archaeon]|nr:alpha/beta fold hydrolase [Candidatus Methanomethylophilaceae archaeon]MDD3128687.1 alpha/beta fold hydrolase [Candidatus Methanomethylophilaceae archaeon]